MPRFSVVAFVLGAFAATACSVSDAGSAGARNDQPPPPETIGQTTEALSAYLTSDGSKPVPIDQVEIHANAETTEALTRSGCGSFVKPGEGGVHFRGRASYPTAFVEWAGRELAKSPSGTPARIAIAVANEKHEVKCIVDVELAASSLEQLTLNGTGVQPEGAKIDDVKFVWEMRGGVKIAVGDVTGDGRGAGIGEGIGDVLAQGEPPPVPIALLVPAVQKVREAAMHTGEYPIFKKGVAVPPPFEADVDEDALADLFDGAIANELESGVIAPQGKTYYVGTANGGVWKTTDGGASRNTNLSLTVKLHKEATFAKKLKSVPVQGFEVVLPISEAQLAAARTKADALAAQIADTLDLDAVSRLVSTLENQPSGSGAPSTRRDELQWYWHGDPAKGTPGAATSFETGLGSFLKTASDIEGLWAYKRLPTAAKIFAQLDTAMGRALSEAATQSSADAAFPLRPGRLRTTGDVDGHDYRVARAAVAQMGANADIIVGAGAGGQALVGVEPDEIDVAVAAKAEALPAVSSVDAAARNFLVAREALLDAPTVTDAALLDLSAKSAALVKELDALSTVTKVRFIASK